jgi:hypothetical protein
VVLGAGKREKYFEHQQEGTTEALKTTTDHKYSCMLLPQK